MSCEIQKALYVSYKEVNMFDIIFEYNERGKEIRIAYQRDIVYQIAKEGILYNGIKVLSVSCPELKDDDNRMYIRGTNDSKDCRAIIYGSLYRSESSCFLNGITALIRAGINVGFLIDGELHKTSACLINNAIENLDEIKTTKDLIESIIKKFSVRL